MTFFMYVPLDIRYLVHTYSVASINLTLNAFWCSFDICTIAIVASSTQTKRRKKYKQFQTFPSYAKSHDLDILKNIDTFTYTQPLAKTPLAKFPISGSQSPTQNLSFSIS